MKEDKIEDKMNIYRVNSKQCAQNNLDDLHLICNKMPRSFHFRDVNCFPVFLGKHDFSHKNSIFPLCFYLSDPISKKYIKFPNSHRLLKLRICMIYKLQNIKYLMF